MKSLDKCNFQSLVPDDLDDDGGDEEDIDNAALANDTVSVPDDSTLTYQVQLFLIMLFLIITASTNGTVFSSDYISASTLKS